MRRPGGPYDPSTEEALLYARRTSPATLLALLLWAAPTSADEVVVETGLDGIPQLEPEQLIECPPEVDDGRYVNEWSSTGDKHERGSCRAGLAVSSWNAWYENGVKAWSGFLEDGRIEGRFRTWYEDGQKRARLEYVQGLLQGDVVLWWEDGTLQGVGAYEQGLAQGCHARWHRDGRRAARGAYLDGVKVGRWVYWDQQGQRSREQHEGQPSKGRCWWPMF